MFKKTRAFVFSHANKAFAASGLMMVSAASQAAVDVTPITAILPDVAAVGVAVFGVLVAIKGIKLIRRAL